MMSILAMAMIAYVSASGEYTPQTYQTIEEAHTSPHPDQIPEEGFRHESVPELDPNKIEQEYPTKTSKPFKDEEEPVQPFADRAQLEQKDDTDLDDEDDDANSGMYSNVKECKKKKKMCMKSGTQTSVDCEIDWQDCLSTGDFKGQDSQSLKQRVTRGAAKARK